MRRRLVWWIGGGILLLGAITTVLVFVLPGGAPTAYQAVLDRIHDDSEGYSARILVNRRWGDGRLVLAGYGKGDERRLAIGFAIQQRGGWRLAGFTEETVESTDVVVGSLLVASSEGGTGQPSWSAAAGELIDRRIQSVEIRWASGQRTSAPRKNDAYLVLLEGTTTPLEARYLASDGTEIAKVPVESR